MTTRKSTYILLTLFSSLVILILLLSSILLIFITFFPPRENLQSKTKLPKNYMMIENNPFKSHTKYGIVNLPRNLEKEEYISYFNKETESVITITNFGGTKYQCTGSCECQSFQNERRTATLLARGLQILIAAFSSSMAITLSKQAFQSQCENQFFDTCDPSHVLSEVEDCKEKGEDDLEFREFRSEEKTKGAKRDRYLCKGYCVGYEAKSDDWFENEFPGIDRSGFMNLGYQEVGLCESLTMEKMVELDPQEIEEAGYGELDQNTEFLPRLFFFEPLNEFCQKSSLLEFKKLSQESRDGFMKEVGEWKKAADEMKEKRVEDSDIPSLPEIEWSLFEDLDTIPFCSGSTRGFGSSDGDLSVHDLERDDNIQCVRMSENMESILGVGKGV